MLARPTKSRKKDAKIDTHNVVIFRLCDFKLTRVTLRDRDLCVYNTFELFETYERRKKKQNYMRSIYTNSKPSQGPLINAFWND